MRAILHPKAGHARPAYAKDTMFLKMVLLAIVLALITTVLMAPPNPAGAQEATPQPGNNCAATDKIDASTAEQAKAKLEAAGYTGITGLEKGCDNVWHAQAMANGKTINVMVTPDGTVNQETD